MKPTKPGDVVCAGSMVLGCPRGQGWLLLLVAIDVYTSEVACHVTAETSPAMIVRELEALAKELPYKVQRVIIDQSFNAYRDRPHFRKFSVLEQFLIQFCISLEALPGVLAAESLESILARVIWSYNNEASQPKLGGLTAVEFRRRFFEESRHIAEHGVDSLDGTSG